MTSVTLSGLSLSYNGGAPVVDQVDITVPRGELMVLLGPSGSGKTSLLRLIAGLVPPDNGDVLFAGSSVLDVPPDKRGAVMVFQDDALFPFRTVSENVAFGLRMRRTHRTERPQRIADALEAVHLAGFEDRWPDELSGGQRQRVALARALVVRPAVLLLDEPLTSLDPALRSDLRDTIVRIQKDKGITTIAVTHDQTEAVAIADRIALMIDGRIRQVGRPVDFFTCPADAEVARFFGAANFLDGDKRGNLVATDLGPLEVADGSEIEGSVVLTIRPESIEIARNAVNSFPAIVTTSRFGGVIADCVAMVDDTILRFSAPPLRCPSAGETVTLYLPPEAIRVLPVSADA